MSGILSGLIGSFVKKDYALVATLTTNQTWTVPAGTNKMAAFLIAGGSFALSGSGGSGGRGGGGGGACAFWDYSPASGLVWTATFGNTPDTSCTFLANIGGSPSGLSATTPTTAQIVGGTGTIIRSSVFTNVGAGTTTATGGVPGSPGGTRPGSLGNGTAGSNGGAAAALTHASFSSLKLPTTLTSGAGGGAGGGGANFGGTQSFITGGQAGTPRGTNDEGTGGGYSAFGFSANGRAGFTPTTSNATRGYGGGGGGGASTGFGGGGSGFTGTRGSGVGGIIYIYTK